MNTEEFIAHIRKTDGEHQPLREHLIKSAEQARKSVEAAGLASMGEMAEVIGLLHDAGKYSKAFQKRILGDKKKVNHSSAGAQAAIKQYGTALGKLIAYCICGHHGGMPDGYSIEGNVSGLNDRITAMVEEYDAFYNEIKLPMRFTTPRFATTAHPGFALSMMVRILFSMLVDADYLDTEAFCQPQAASKREQWAELQTVHERFFKHMNGLNTSRVKTNINYWRDVIYQACLKAAQLPKGVFTLSVPTGGGKTLSSMAFALEHARVHQMRRVIYAIPYTSIIEQNAEVFRKAIGDNSVLEHHSNFKLDDEEEADEYLTVHRLASENWDAPIVVTTNVQFFESLFSNLPSRCRKLHNIANSVVILDEAQMIPDELLKPCLSALQCLQRDYNCSVVLCTATQPALSRVWPDVQDTFEIVPEPMKLYDALKRVSVSYVGVQSKREVAAVLSGHQQVLCIVNSRSAARDIYSLLPQDNGCFHLSTLMCAQHRTVVLEKIRTRLKDGKVCRVVSTQLVEAGVDIDFPVVYRAVAGIDSIAQAAGRCNREGRQASGDVFVFTPMEGMPKGWLEHTAMLGLSLLKETTDVLSQETVQRYFTQRYNDGGINALDKKDIIRQLDAGSNGNIPFSHVSKQFQIIESSMEQIVIPYDEKCKEILREAATSDYPAKYMRNLQRYVVGVYSQDFEILESGGYLEHGILPCSLLKVDIQKFGSLYSQKTGLSVSQDTEALS